MTERVIYIRRCTVHITKSSRPSPCLSFDSLVRNLDESRGAARLRHRSDPAFGLVQHDVTRWCKVLKIFNLPISDDVEARGGPREPGLCARALVWAIDANSASSYINDPFGHSSKEVLYKSKTLHLFASIARSSARAQT